jgi:hypothetical protein
VTIDSEFRFIPDSIERMLGESKRYLSNLIKKLSTFTIINNKYEFQSKDPDIATCSRWVILRIECAKMGYNLKQFTKMINNESINTDIPPDILVLYYVKFITDKKI